jgi:DNA repair exonuclease SbcCD ATPase subunit
MFMRIAVIVLILFASAALAVWHYSPRRTVAPSVAQTAAKSQALPQASGELRVLQDRMSREQARLDQLKASLDQISGNAGPGGSDDSRAQDVNGRVQVLEQRLTALAQDQRAAKANAQDYQSGVQAERAGASYGIEQQIQDVNNSIVDLQNQVAEARSTPTTDLNGQALQVQNLETQIANQMIVRDQLAGETQDMMSERVEVQRELNDLRAEAAFWRERSADKDGIQKVNAARIETLQAQISDQQAVVDQLRNQYAQQSAASPR